MSRDAIASLVLGESTTIAGATVSRVGLIGYSVNGGPALPLDGAVATVDALASAQCCELVAAPRDGAIAALAQYRIPLPADRPGLMTLAKRLRKYGDADADDAAAKVEAVIATMGEEQKAA